MLSRYYPTCIDAYLRGSPMEAKIQIIVHNAVDRLNQGTLGESR